MYFHKKDEKLQCRLYNTVTSLVKMKYTYPRTLDNMYGY